jgi:Zinc knuckle
MGLKSWLATAILRKDNCLADNDLEGWQEATRKEVVKAKRIKQEAGGFGRGGLTVWENMFQQFFKDHPIPKKAPRDPDAMDVDVIDTKPKGRPPQTGGRFQQLTSEEWKKLMSEGHCFRCKKQGHMSRNCPDRKTTPQKKPSAKVMEAEEEESTAEDDKDEVMSQASTKVRSIKGKGGLMVHINALTIEEKEELFDKLISEGFWGIPSWQPGLRILAWAEKNKICTLNNSLPWMYHFPFKLLMWRPKK